MRAYRIEAGGERGGKSPAGGPALWANGDRPVSVLRRSSRRPPSYFRGVIDWEYVRLVLAVVATFLVALHIAMGGGL